MLCICVTLFLVSMGWCCVIFNDNDYGVGCDASAMVDKGMLCNDSI